MFDPLFLVFCACLFGFILLMGFAFHPSSETTSISQRLEGLKAGQQQQRAKTSLRDEDEMGKSPFTRIVLPIVDKLSRFLGSMTSGASLNRARISIAQAGLQGKVFPAQITTISYILMFVIPFMSLSFTGIPTGLLTEGQRDPVHWLSSSGIVCPSGISRARPRLASTKFARRCPLRSILFPSAWKRGWPSMAPWPS